jgi:hypothetical protein
MKLRVLYETSGQILSLSVIDQNAHGSDAMLQTMRSGVEEAEGQRVAILDLPEAWHGRRLSDIHRAFVVIHDGHTAQLRPHPRDHQAET